MKTIEMKMNKMLRIKDYLILSNRKNIEKVFVYTAQAIVLIGVCSLFINSILSNI